MSIKVNVNQPKWIPSGIKVSKGNRVVITATGTIKVQHQGKTLGPGGDKNKSGQEIMPPDENFVRSDLPAHALIGTISETSPRVPLRKGQDPQIPFLVGDKVELTAEADGEFYFIVNDNIGFFFDNTGTFDVTIDFTVDFPINAGFEFQIGENYYSSSKDFVLVFQPDGNFVIYKGQKIDPAYATWAFNKQPNHKNELSYESFKDKIKSLVFDASGNLVAYDSNKQVIWQTETTGHQNAQLQMNTTDGTLYITNGGNAIWPS